MVLAMIIGMMDNPASRIDFSKEPTISRNKGKASVENVPAVELQPVEELVPLEKKSLPVDESGE